MKRAAFRVCPACGNVIVTTGDAEVSCCGRKLPPLVALPADEAHAVHVEPIAVSYTHAKRSKQSRDWHATTAR